MISKDFFTRDSITIARELLGKKIIFNGKEAMIVETEAYTINDPGSHAYKGRTKRNELMFHEGGCLYVYLCYGVYNLMNIVTDKKGLPSAVLIRAVEPLNFKAKTNGPGLTTKALGINRNHNGLVIGNEMKILDNIKPKKVIQTTRIGLKKGDNLPYRFYIENNPFVSMRKCINTLNNL
ncbi:MAG: DNA-3-methyladenine glycosylase [Candidatus Nanoarchaeia archaeon]|jgi:DNA-3-methyladenine glycosylase